MSKYKIQELELEYEKIRYRLRNDEQIFCIYTPVEKGTLLVSVYIKTSKSSRKVDFIGFISTEVHAEQNDSDRQVCAEFISTVVKDLHWKVSKGYCRTNCTEYYIRPDWTYWYSKFPR